MGEITCVELLKKDLLGSLIGLGRAVEGNINRPNCQTNQLLLIGFKMLSPHSDASFECIQKHINLLRDEKYRLVSRCLTCKKQCGRNNDYDIFNTKHLAADTCAIKYELLAMIIACAEYTNKAFIDKELYAQSIEFLYDGLFMFGSGCSSDKHKTCLQNGAVLLNNLMNGYFESYKIECD